VEGKSPLMYAVLKQPLVPALLLLHALPEQCVRHAAIKDGFHVKASSIEWHYLFLSLLRQLDQYGKDALAHATALATSPVSPEIQH